MNGRRWKFVWIGTAGGLGLAGCVALFAALGSAFGLFNRPVAAQSVQVSQAGSPTLKSNAPKSDEFATVVRPLFAKYCLSCHNDEKVSAGLTLQPFTDSASTRKVRDLWDKVKEEVEAKHMPPKNKPQPTDAERKQILAWIDSTAIKVDCSLTRDPGRPTIRRLNRNEYDNTIRDLVGVDFKPADDFPSDDVGYGFDNIGDVLSMPPILLEKYLSAADKILETALPTPRSMAVTKETFRPQNVRSTLGPLSKQRNRIALTQNGSATFSYEFTHTGEYTLRARAYGEQAGSELPKMAFQLDGKTVKSADVEAVEGKPKSYETRVKVTAGRHDVAFAFTNDFMDDKKKADRNLYIELMEVEGPFNPTAQEPPASYRRIMIAKPTGPSDRESAARKIAEAFAYRAFRRPVTSAEIDRLIKLYRFADDGKVPFESAVRHMLKGVLVSPHFLFRIERDSEPNNPDAIHPVSAHELAVRLSYFLWSSMPDEELFKHARDNTIRNPGVLEAQIKRMLKDPRSKALSDNFAGQWLMLRSLATLTPDRNTFRSFDPSLRSAMIRETEMYFDHIVRDDRSVIEFLDSNYTFVNERLARHYGISGVTGTEFRKVTLTDANRGGLVTQASILTVTSNPTRTSPVKRGKWILENILGTPPPPPPPDVPDLEDTAKAALTGSLRKRMEQHRTNPACATCHAKLDPLGFGLENFDGIGAWRTMDGNFKIDPTGELPDGSKFNGPKDLRKVLTAKSELFRRNLADKMLTYALGRGLEYYDKCALDDIVKATQANGDRFSALVLAVVKTDAFQKRRGMAAKP